MEDNDHRTSMSMSRETWLAIRRLQEEGKVKSIRDALEQGVRLIQAQDKD